MTEITARERPRTFIPRSGTRFYINHPDFLLHMCKQCGGCATIIMHVAPAKIGWTPPVKQCKCEVQHG